MRIFYELVLYKYACVCQTLHSHRVFPALLLSSEQQAEKKCLEEQSGILPLTKMMVQMLIVTLNDSQIGWDTVNLAKVGTLVQQVHWADFTSKNLEKIDGKMKKVKKFNSFFLIARTKYECIVWVSGKEMKRR